MKVIKIFFIISVFSTTGVFSQVDTTKLVKYSPAFKFTEGIYLNFDQVRENKPILKSRIVSDVNIRDIDFFEKVLRSKKIIYYDDYGIKQAYEIEKIWGYCRKGTLYIQVEGEFNRIPVVGKICHFVANITVYRDRYYNQYDPYYNYNSTLRPQQPSYELKQFLLDFETGSIMEYDYQTLSVILMRDPDLHEEFINFKKKKRKKLKFLYLRKYNEKHPLYIPIY